MDVDTAQAAVALAAGVPEAAQAIAQVAPTVVKTTTGDVAAAGIWTLVGTVTLGLAGILARFLPQWRTIGVGQRKSDLDRLDERIDALESSLKVETTARVSAEKQISYLIAGFSMVSSELERQDPGNPVIKQARQMVARATTHDSLAGDLINALGMEPDSEVKR